MNNLPLVVLLELLFVGTNKFIDAPYGKVVCGDYVRIIFDSFLMPKYPISSFG